jgi:hypothetical protein
MVEQVAANAESAFPATVVVEASAMTRLLVLAFLVCFSASLSSQQGVRGEARAVAAAARLVEQVGGAAAWSNPTFTVEERGFMRSGEVAQLRITRDLKRGARIFESVTPSRTVVEWVSPERGWVRRDGKLSLLTREELAAELQGLRQEPYAIYYRLATNDRSLRVALRDQDSTLLVYDQDERLLCWFQLDGRGALLGWGNVYEGAVNQHYYGPVAPMGDANLPKWGAASNGSFRFEYISARLNDEPVVEPTDASTPGEAAPAEQNRASRSSIRRNWMATTTSGSSAPTVGTQGGLPTTRSLTRRRAVLRTAVSSRSCEEGSTAATCIGSI